MVLFRTYGDILHNTCDPVNRTRLIADRKRAAVDVSFLTIGSDDAKLLVMLLFGTVHSLLGLLAIVVAVLTGLAFGAPIFAFTATQRTDTSFPLIGRLLITPLFLLGGVFFPIHQLPQLVQGFAWLTPLAHGVALARDLAVGAASPSAGIHLAVLLAYAAIGIVAARITLQRRLVP